MRINSPFSFLTLAVCFLMMSCDSPKTTASFKVLKDKAENQLVDLAGKGQVALQMHRDRHAKLKTNLIKIKAASKRAGRELTETKARAAKETSPEAKANLEALAQTYSQALEQYGTAEESATAALQASAASYEKLKVKVESMERQIDLYRTMTDTEVTFDFKTNKNEVTELIESLEGDLDEAEAAFEIESLNLDLR